jgi:hypothetical protein
LQAGANEFGNDVGGNEMPRSEEEVGVRFHKGDGTETEPEVSGGGGGGDCCCCGGVVVVVVVCGCCCGFVCGCCGFGCCCCTLYLCVFCVFVLWMTCG